MPFSSFQIRHILTNAFIRKGILGVYLEFLQNVISEQEGLTRGMSEKKNSFKSLLLYMMYFSIETTLKSSVNKVYSLPISATTIETIIQPTTQYSACTVRYSRGAPDTPRVFPFSYYTLADKHIIIILYILREYRQLR